MPRMFPPHFQGVRYNGANVTEEGVEVMEVDVADLIADRWTMSPPVEAVFPPVTNTTADVAALAHDDEEPQS